MKYEVKFTNQFKKDLKLAKKQNKNIEKLFSIVEKLANGNDLEVKYKDHALTGNYKNCRECHIKPDQLLIYEIFDDTLVLMLPEPEAIRNCLVNQNILPQTVRQDVFITVGFGDFS